MGARVDLQALLVQLLGSKNVYFQPGPTVSMKYPAIVYERSAIANSFANDLVYKQVVGYTVTVIDPNPDSVIVTKVSQLPTCKYNRGFKADNLNHDVFTVNY